MLRQSWVQQWLVTYNCRLFAPPPKKKKKKKTTTKKTKKKQKQTTITWTNADLLSIEPWEENFNGILIEIPSFALKKLHLTMTSPNSQSLSSGSSLLNKWNQDLGGSVGCAL